VTDELYLLVEANLTVVRFGAMVANVIALALEMPGAVELAALVFQM
jgi:hypothetical protein